MNADPSVGNAASSNAVATSITSTSTISSTTPNEPVLSGRAQAYEAIARFVNDSNARIVRYDQQREAALAVLREPRPEPPMKMSDAEWKGFIIQKAIAMQNWNSGSNDRGGKNDRESNAINQVDNALTTNAKYMSYEDAMAMLDFASGRNGKLGQGLQGSNLQTHGGTFEDGAWQHVFNVGQGLQGSNLQTHGGTFEDGAWQHVFNAVRSMSVAAQIEHEGNVAAWKQRQATAKLELAKVTNLIGATQSNLGKTVVAFNDMMQKDAIQQTRLMTQQLLKSSSLQPKTEPSKESEEDKGFEAITVTVNNPASTNRPKTSSPVNVKVTVNLDRDFDMPRMVSARAEPVVVSSRFAQG